MITNDFQLQLEMNLLSFESIKNIFCFGNFFLLFGNCVDTKEIVLGIRGKALPGIWNSWPTCWFTILSSWFFFFPFALSLTVKNEDSSSLNSLVYIRMVIQILLLKKKFKTCYNHFYFTSNFINLLSFQYYSMYSSKKRTNNEIFFGNQKITISVNNAS